MPRDLVDEEMTKRVDTVAFYTFAPKKQTNKKGNLKQCHNYRTISLINHPSKIMLRLSSTNSRLRLRNCSQKLKQVLDQVEHIFNNRVIIEKHLQHQHDLFHNYINFKKVFDRVWHAGLLQVLKSFNTDESIVQATEALYI